MKSIIHRLVIKASPEKVYESLTTQQGLAGWWTPETTAKPETGSISRFAFEPGYFKEMEVTELVPFNRVKWLCRKGHEEWIGTTIDFELQPHENGTVLFFRHDGWKEHTPVFAMCSFDWAIFLRSLKFLCETGKGYAYPNHYN